MAGDTLVDEEIASASSEFELTNALAVGASGREFRSIGAVSDFEESTETAFKETSFAVI